MTLRGGAGRAPEGTTGMKQNGGHRALVDQHLPLNRKERYFTGTVLPAIVCADNFRHFDLFLRLLTTAELPRVDPHPERTNLQFFTEYSFVEALTGAAKGRFPDPPHTKDTPDLVCFLRGHVDVLIAVEAKMYDSPSGADLRVQFDAQRRLLAYLQRHLPASDVVHVMLLPEKLARRAGLGEEIPVVTWESVVDAYLPVLGADHYFLAVLRLALERYDALVSSAAWQSGKNADGWLPGSTILKRAEQGDRSIRQVGRHRGLDGPVFAEDLRTGGWKNQPYEVSAAETPANRNWFPVEDFVRAVRGSVPAAVVSAPFAAAAAPRSIGVDVAKPHHRTMTGDEIVTRRGDPTIRQVGRGGGLHGPNFVQDVGGGTWRTQRYEVCSADGPPNRNWFAVEAFLAAVRG